MQLTQLPGKEIKSTGSFRGLLLLHCEQLFWEHCLALYIMETPWNVSIMSSQTSRHCRMSSTAITVALWACSGLHETAALKVHPAFYSLMSSIKIAQVTYLQVSILYTFYSWSTKHSSKVCMHLCTNINRFLSVKILTKIGKLHWPQSI